MTSEPVAQLHKHGAHFELVYPEYRLTLRAPYAEWIFEAAAEILSAIEKLRIEGEIDELEMIKQFVDGDTINIALDSIKYENGNRFDVVPQCVLTVADTDYRWVSPLARDPKASQFGQRLHDMSLTRSGDYATRNGQTKPLF